MVLERDIGTLSTTLFDDYQVNLYYFAKIESDAETLRYTQRFDNWTGDLDGASETWVGGDTGLMVERVSQSNSSILDVSAISFKNVYDAGAAAAGPWTQRELAGTLRGRKVTVWVAWWPKDDDADDAIIDKYVLYKGRVGMVEFNETCNISLVPFRASWNLKTGRFIGPKCSYVHMYGDPESCQFAGDFGTFPTCGGSLDDCIARDNQANFGGFPLAPKPNTVVVWGGKQRFTV